MACAGASREDMQYRVDALIEQNARLRKELSEDPIVTDSETTLNDAYRQVCLENEQLKLRRNVVQAEKNLEDAKRALERASELRQTDPKQLKIAVQESNGQESEQSQ